MREEQGRWALARAQAGKNQEEEQRVRHLGRWLDRRCQQAKLTKEERGGRGGLGRRHWKLRTRVNRGSKAKSIERIWYGHVGVVNFIIRQVHDP